MTIGHAGRGGIISYDVTFTLPSGERHTQAVFEALTGYMPPEFTDFAQFNPQTGELEPLSDGPGEIPRPIVFAVAEGTHAMGIYAPPQPHGKVTGPTYGRFRFSAEKVVKWNCVFRLREEAGIRAGEESFRMFVVVGDRASVTADLRALHAEFGVDK